MNRTLSPRSKLLDAALVMLALALALVWAAAGPAPGVPFY